MATDSIQLVCLENPLLDIQATGNEQLLAKYGLQANDAILAEEKHMGLYEDLLQHYEAKLIAGGAAQNSARGAQYMLPAGATAFVGCVGRDKYAAVLEDVCGQAGVRTAYRYDDAAPTGRCGVVITGQNRSLCTDLAAANCYRLDHLRQSDVWALVERARVLYVGGYHLTVCVPAVLALAEHAAQQGKTFVMNLSAPFIPAVFKDALDQTAPYWDWLVGNETEAAAYADSHALGTSDLGEIAAALATLPKKGPRNERVVVITQGTAPTIVVAARDGQVYERTEVAVPALAADKICDTNGAGDAFAGGLLAGIVKGYPRSKCVAMGQWLARLSIQELGPSYPYPVQKCEHDEE